MYVCAYTAQHGIRTGNAITGFSCCTLRASSMSRPKGFAMRYAKSRFDTTFSSHSLDFIRVLIVLSRYAATLPIDRIPGRSLQANQHIEIFSPSLSLSAAGVILDTYVLSHRPSIVPKFLNIRIQIHTSISLEHITDSKWWLVRRIANAISYCGDMYSIRNFWENEGRLLYSTLIIICD